MNYLHNIAFALLGAAIVQLWRGNANAALGLTIAAVVIIGIYSGLKE